MHRSIVAVFLAAVLGGGLARAAEPMQLWLYYSTNLYVDKNLDAAEAIWKRAAAAGYTHVMLADSKFAKLGDMDQRYHANLARARKTLADLKLQVVPCVFPIGYSNDLLWHDPNLAEGLPAQDTLMVVRGGEARVLADPPVAFAARWDFVDDSVKLAGNTATVDNNPGNARLCQTIKVSPYRCYHISVEVRTEDYSASPEIKVLVGNRSLQYTSIGARKTQEWTRHDVVFNSLENASVRVYLGVWGAGRGRLHWRDWKIEEVALLNVLRREGTPVVVKVEGRPEPLVEGRDYQPIADPRMGNQPWKGAYEIWHEPPVLRTKLPDGTRLRISWYHPAIIHDEQVMCCISEPATTRLLEDQARRMKAAWGAGGYMMSYDEIRTLNWDASCQSRKLDAGAILADHVARTTRLLQGVEAYTWSDMFDPHHNAHKDYYLVRGDLSGSWEGLDKRVVIMNWNFGKRDESLKFFADRGHRQVIAGYYDGPPQRVTQWLESARKVKGVVGVMYTTWQRRYDDLEAFARIVRQGQ